MIIEKRHLPECVIAVAMRIAAEVVERLQFSEDGDVDLRAESLLEFIQRGDFITQQKRAQCIGAEGCWAHNVIVPIERGSPIRNYNKSQTISALHLDLLARPVFFFGHPSRFTVLPISACEAPVMTENRSIVSCYFCEDPKFRLAVAHVLSQMRLVLPTDGENHLTLRLLCHSLFQLRDQPVALIPCVIPKVENPLALPCQAAEDKSP